MVISMGVGLFIFLGLFAVFVLFFVSRRLSPIPYFPSNHKDIPLILKFMALRDRQILYDLGAGDGVVIFEAARSPVPRSTRFVAVEINPILVALMWIRRLFHPNRKNISLEKNDIFTMPITPPRGYTPIFFTYISPWYLEKTVVNLLRQFKSIELVTYFYAVPQSKNYRLKLVKKSKNIHSVFRYKVSR